MPDLSPRIQWTTQDASGSEVTLAPLKLLEGVAQFGKLTEAARACELSYRHAWNLLEKWRLLFGSPLVELTQGRGAALTPLGERLMRAEQRARARLTPTLESLGSEVNAAIADLLGQDRKHLRIHASHGYAVERMVDMLKTSGEPLIELTYRDATEALASLGRNRCDLAGFHIPEGPIAQKLMPRYATLLSARNLRIIELCTRVQGLILAKTNPKRIRKLADLMRGDVRFINRQRGSGTRALTEALIADARLDPTRIQGFDAAEFTHDAVAAFVASDMADVGIGVETAARKFGLDFAPLVTERYLFACKVDSLEWPLMQGLLDLLSSAPFRSAVSGIPGYNAQRSGTIYTISALVSALNS